MGGPAAPPGGVLWHGMAFETPVIPAKAGIQSGASAFPKVCRVHSRPSADSGQAFRGSDYDSQRGFSETTPPHSALSFSPDTRNSVE